MERENKKETNIDKIVASITIMGCVGALVGYLMSNGTNKQQSYMGKGFAMGALFPFSALAYGLREWYKG